MVGVRLIVPSVELAKDVSQVSPQISLQELLGVRSSFFSVAFGFERMDIVTNHVSISTLFLLSLSIDHVVELVYRRSISTVITGTQRHSETVSLASFRYDVKRLFH